MPQENDPNRALTLDQESIVAVESSIRNLDRLTKTFHEICSDLNPQILLLSGSDSDVRLFELFISRPFSDSNDRISSQEIENIAYQACDKVYKKEDAGPYDNLW